MDIGCEWVVKKISHNLSFMFPINDKDMLICFCDPDVDSSWRVLRLLGFSVGGQFHINQKLNEMPSRSLTAS